MGTAVIASGIVSVLYTVLAFVFLSPLCRLFGATDNIMPYALGYGRIIVIGFPFVIIGTVINSAIRTDGSPRYAMFAMMIGAVLNTILDPLFIFVFHWGVEGAALATILSQLVGLLFNVAYLFKFKNIRFGKAALVPDGAIAARLASLGFASCFNNLTSTVVAFVSNNLLTQYGALSKYGPDIPLTTFGLCMKVSMIAFSVGIGVASGSQPIIGFNYGARKFDRVKKTFLLSAGICTAITVVSWVIFQCFPLQLIRIFGTESALYEEFAVQCFHVYLLLTFLNDLQMCTSVFFQAIGQVGQGSGRVAVQTAHLLYPGHADFGADLRPDRHPDGRPGGGCPGLYPLRGALLLGDQEDERHGGQNELSLLCRISKNQRQAENLPLVFLCFHPAAPPGACFSIS